MPACYQKPVRVVNKQDWSHNKKCVCVCVCVSHMIIGRTERCRADWTIEEQSNRRTKKFIECGAQ